MWELNGPSHQRNNSRLIDANRPTGPEQQPVVPNREVQELLGAQRLMRQPILRNAMLECCTLADAQY